jgi:hypothetical protein
MSTSSDRGLHDDSLHLAYAAPHHTLVNNLHHTTYPYTRECNELRNRHVEDAHRVDMQHQIDQLHNELNDQHKLYSKLQRDYAHVVDELNTVQVHSAQCKIHTHITMQSNTHITMQNTHPSQCIPAPDNRTCS